MRTLLAFAATMAVLAVATAPVLGSPISPAGTAPVVVLALSLPKVYAGETATVRWRTEGATSCRASGAWTGVKPLQGEQQVGPLFDPGAFRLDCSNGSGTSSRSVNYAVSVDRPTTGIGVFDIGCNFSHSLPDDPIVFPGQPGASHLHDFFGFTGTNARSTSEQMRLILKERPDATTCTEGVRRDGDPPASNASAYWVPAMYVNGQKVNGQNMHIYYRQEIKPVVRVFPPGFRMLAGNPQATPEQAKAEGLIRWWCGGLNSPEVDKLPSDCEGRGGIHAQIRFPACWDGRVDSPNHKDHLAYKRETGKCPDTHPFRLPRILMHVTFEVRDQIGRNLRATDKITLASGGMWTLHGDYLFAWDPFRLDLLVHTCLNGKVNCKLAPPPPSKVGLEEGPQSTEDSPKSPPQTTTPKDKDAGKQKELETRLEVLDKSPESPRADTRFSLKFVAVRGNERLEIQSVFCDAVAGTKTAKLERKVLEGRIGICVWQLPALSGETLRATIGALVDGHRVHRTIEGKIR